MTQLQKAQAFHALHAGPDPLTLYNIWDIASAKWVQDSGASAIATGSWSVAAAQGYADGENLPLENVIRLATSLVAQTDLPVSIDFECGYAADLPSLTNAAKSLFETGIVGINFEDQTLHTKVPGMNDVPTQQGRISCLRGAADAMGLPIFINARTDLFLQASDPAAHHGLMDTAIARGQAYAEAGASGFFVPGLANQNLIAEICNAVPLPVNIMAAGSELNLPALLQSGVRRVSYGPSPYQGVMAHFKTAAERLYGTK